MSHTLLISSLTTLHRQGHEPCGINDLFTIYNNDRDDYYGVIRKSKKQNVE